MPSILNEAGYRFFFHSNEGSPLEPAHIHVRRAGNLAKFWLVPDVLVSESYGFNSGELRDIEARILHNVEMMRESWNAYFSS